MTYVQTFLAGCKKELQVFLQDSFKVSYTPSGLNKLLHRIGLSHQTIHKLPGRCPVDKQQAWIDQFEDTLQDMDLLTEVILFMDSVHHTHNTTYSKVWSLKGVPRWIQSNTGRQRLNISGAYNPLEQEVVMVEDTTINGQTTIKLLEKCLETYREKQSITIYLDNAAYHKSAEVKEFLASQDKIKLSFLPPDSPNLNLIERLWKFTSEKVINLKYDPDFKQLKERIMTSYKDIGQYADELKDRINFKFQTFEGMTM
jgi:transposase